MPRETYKDLVKRLVEDDAFRGWLISSPLVRDNAFSMYDLTRDQAEMAEQVAWLKGYNLFESVSAEEWLTLLSMTSLEKFPAGTTLIRQGETGDALYLLLSGEVAVLMRDVNGNWRHVATLTRGAIIGELAVLYQIPRTATVLAHTDVVALSLGKEAYQELSQKAPVFASNIGKEAAGRLPT